ncbi:MAG: response regulator [Dehalococcoidia bacterium]|jgi:DNA-binding NtrC family response regulator|nr:response regulator [Dehalococcoidia bacterium]
MFRRNLTHRKVLVIEDDDAIVRVLRLSLRSNGFETARAESGREALTAMDEGDFDAVILDLCLPDGRGGDVLQRLQAAGHCPVWVVMSALDEDEAVRRYGPLQGPFLPKPFDPWDLIRLLDRLLGPGPEGREQQVAGAA